jgi:hypothetical protein
MKRLFASVILGGLLSLPVLGADAPAPTTVPQSGDQTPTLTWRIATALSQLSAWLGTNFLNSSAQVYGATGVSNSLSGFLNTLPYAVYKASPVQRVDGSGGPLLTGPFGNLLLSMSNAGDTLSATSAWVTNVVITNAACKLISVEIYNGSTNWAFASITDSATAAANGSIAKHSWPIAPTNSVAFDFSTAPEAYSSGVCIGISTTQRTNTFVTSPTCDVTAKWRP